MSIAPDPMEELRARFRERLGQDRGPLSDALRQGDLQSLRATCHRIAGAGGMFGYAELSELASEAEGAIDSGVGAERLEAVTMELLSAIDAAVSNADMRQA